MNANVLKWLGGLVLILAVYMAYHAVAVLAGKTAFPQGCDYRNLFGLLFCELENALFKQGGNFIVGVMSLVIGLCFFVVSYWLYSTQKTRPC